MVLEYAGGGDLLQKIKTSYVDWTLSEKGTDGEIVKIRTEGHLPEEEVKDIFRQICFGLANIHCRSVLHRDIKLDNILLDEKGGVKICDFGVSRILKKDQVI